MNRLRTALNVGRMNRYVRRRRAQLDFIPADAPFDGASFGSTDASLAFWDVKISQRASDFRLSCSPEAALRRLFYKSLSYRMLPYIYYMRHAGAEAKELIVDASDGDRSGFAEIGFSSCQPARLLVPDQYFFEGNGYQTQRALRQENDVPWSERDDTIIWRGQLNGQGICIAEPSLTENGLLNQRLRMALACLGTDIDFRFVGHHEALPVLERAGLMGDRIAAATWLNRKYAIDIDGYSNAWDNLYHRLLFGCCVLKVESQVGFRQWYYDRLRPFEHYVPISADLSDLQEQVDWVRSHPAEAGAIAKAGSELAHEMTFESETQLAAEKVRALCRARP